MRILSGIHTGHFKNTNDCGFETIPLPAKVKIPMSMHMGVPCEPIVKVGDEVMVGQKIGDSDAPFSVPVHSSVSGKVKAISSLRLANGSSCKCIEIETDGKQSTSIDVRPHTIDSRETFVKAVRESGICGMGGAGFPTHIKLNPKSPVDTLIINAAECEPYITSDYHTMLESAKNIYDCAKMIMRFLEIKSCIIGIENNKPKAIELFKEICGDDENFKVQSLPSSYPQGAEKVLIYNTCGRIVEEGKIPADYGVIVMNVSTVANIYIYVMTGMPLVSRSLTFDGDVAGKKCNLKVPIGTPVTHILEHTKTNPAKIFKLISGGPMMGMCLPSADYPVTKTMNSILAFRKYKVPEKTACIRCARCVSACPLGLMPVEIEKAYKAENAEKLKKLKVNLCTNCGSCSYVCPANRNPAETNQLAKALLPKK